MKKNRFLHEWDSHSLMKTFRIMRITVFLLLASILQTFANDAYSQKTRLSLDFPGTKLVDVLDEIESKTEFYFLFNEKLIDTDRKVNMSVKNEKIDEILYQLFAGTDVIYTITDRKIILAPSFLSENEQQQNSISGKVTDEFGESLPGVTVIVKGTTQGTVTNVDGEYTLSIINEGVTLQFSFVGMLTQEIEVGNQTTINVTMEADAIGIEEVVANGYGTMKKRDITGAVSSIDVEDEPLGSISTISHVLAGKAAGLRVTQNSAQVGGGSTFRIRGAASIAAGNDPLIIIDGFPVTNSGSLSSGNKYTAGSTDNIFESINPNDIESIEVLKDASSTAIYGARAANGVIIVTTKRGGNRKPQVKYSGTFSVQEMKEAYDVLNVTEYMEQGNRYARELWKKNNGLEVYEPYINLSNGHVVPDFVPRWTADEIRNAKETDWLDKITRTGMLQQHNFSIDGKADNTSFITSLNYLQQDGVIKNNDLNRFTFRINVDQKLSDIFKAGTSLNYSSNEYNNSQLGGGNVEQSGIISSASRFAPNLPVFDDNGDYLINPSYPTVPNPVSLLTVSDVTKKDRLLASGYIEAEPLKDLILKLQGGMDRKFQKRKAYLPTTTLYGDIENGDASIKERNNTDYLMDFTISYRKKLGEHSINALAGYSYQKFQSEGFAAGNKDFIIDGFLYNNLGAGAYATPSVGSYASSYSLSSVFGRLFYNYKEKYLLTATIRADGTAIFASGNRWGYFPSASAAWRFSNESFMESLSGIISNGKVRLSYGQTGNSNVGNRIYDQFAVGKHSYFGGTLNSGVYLSQLGNKELTWETTSETNIGLDLGFFKNRINITGEYFNRVISDLLVPNKSLPSYNEISSIAANIGKTQSTGYEITINTANIVQRDLKWSTDITLSHYEDNWKERDPNWRPSAYQSVDDPIRAWFTYESDGLIQAGEERPAHQPALLPGQVKFVDQNNDDKLDSEDIVLIGTTDPQFYFGVNNTLTWKNFDVGISIYGETGRLSNMSYYDGDWMWGDNRSMVTDIVNGVNQPSSYKDLWASDNIDSSRPSMFVSQYGMGNYYVQKRNYVRIRNITVGYILPVKKQLFKKIRVYADVSNPFVFTNWTGLDPETDNNMYAYPNTTNYSFGVDITF